MAHHIEVLNDMGHGTQNYVVSDGGSTSRIWMQIVADVLQRPMQRLIGHPGSCLGAVWTASIDSGLADNWSGASPPLTHRATSNFATFIDAGGPHGWRAVVTLHALAWDHFPEGMEPLDCEPAMAPKGVHAFMQRTVFAPICRWRLRHRWKCRWFWQVVRTLTVSRASFRWQDWRGAPGIELDYITTALGSPPNILRLASSENHSPMMLLVNEEFGVVPPNLGGDQNDRVHADLAFSETPCEGALFATSSIAWCGSLSHNENNVARITWNVLKRFSDPAPFSVG
jgi:hypothetical protein